MWWPVTQLARTLTAGKNTLSNRKDSTINESWHACKNCAFYCAILAMPAIYLQWWWALPILAFVGFMAVSYAGTIKNKVGSGYPYLEPGDVMGVVFGGAIMFFF